MTDYFFLDENHNILTDEKARSAHHQRNDAAYLSNGFGVVKVPRERWQVAQEFERRFWMEKSTTAKEDRNEDHLRNFDGYAALRGKHFRHAIELGCGPFTNLRLIAPLCRIDRCTLLDPLIESYLHHEHNTYDINWLRSETNQLNEFLGKHIALRAVRRCVRKLWPQSLRKMTRVDQLLPCPIEELPSEMKYDLIVIINVIEHCYDIHQVFERIRAIAQPGAMLVFADRYYDHSVVADWVTRSRYDAGHPLLVDRSVVDGFLASSCDQVFRNVEHHEWVVRGFDFSHEAVYFIGRMKA